MRQRGFVTRAQLLAAGLSRHAIAHRLRTGRLQQWHKGVYLFGRPSMEHLGEETAAILSFEGAAVLSHQTAGFLWGMLEARPPDVAVTVWGADRRARRGVSVHRVSALDRRDVRLRQRLPLTAPARTALDMAAGLSAWELERAVAEARVRGLLRDGELEAALERWPHRPGVKAVRALLQAGRDPALTRSQIERRLLGLLRAADLPRPLVNAKVQGFEVDFLWPEQRLIVETDGFQFHGHRRAFEHDRRRDQLLVAAGFRVIRITWRQLVEEPFGVVARIALALGAQAA